MYNIALVSHYICEKFYKITYKRNNVEKTVYGYLLNYANGNIVLLAEEGVYHIQYKDIIFMAPDGEKILEEYKKYNTEYIDLLMTFIKKEEKNEM